MDLISQCEDLRQELRQSIKLLRKNGDALAKAENEYQVCKAKRVLLMKAEGATMTEISLAIKGQEDVAEKLFARDTAQVMYDANKEHINGVKLQIRVLESQIAREWNNGVD